jgi:hypothetical protein
MNTETGDHSDRDVACARRLLDRPKMRRLAAPGLVAEFRG